MTNDISTFDSSQISNEANLIIALCSSQKRIWSIYRLQWARYHKQQLRTTCIVLPFYLFFFSQVNKMSIWWVRLAILNRIQEQGSLLGKECDELDSDSEGVASSKGVERGRGPSRPTAGQIWHPSENNTWHFARLCRLKLQKNIKSYVDRNIGLISHQLWIVLVTSK